MKIASTVSIALSLGIGLSGCGGGSSEGMGAGPVSGAPPVTNTAPTMTGLPAEKVVLQDATSDVIPFSVNDSESGAVSVGLTITSSAPEIIAPEAIQLQGNGSARGLVIVPVAGAAGISTVTLKAVDPSGLTTSQSLRVEVTGVQRSYREMVGTVFAQGAESAGEDTVGFTWVDNPENEEAAFDNLLN